MEFLGKERSCLDLFMPGLDAACSEVGFDALEDPSSPAIELFRRAGGCGLVVDREAGGGGATSVDMVRIQRAIGARAPSLAIATTMHHFSVAALMEMSTTGLESIMLEAIATSRLLVASGFAEGRPGQSVLSTSIRADRIDGGIVVNGTKKPCSLSRSMDLLTVSVMLDGKFAVALVPTSLPGITVEPYWNGGALRAAQSDAVNLRDVELPDRLVSYAAVPDLLDEAQIGAFVWFETLIAASYIGIASGLVEPLLLSARVDPTVVLRAVAHLESAMMAIERQAESLAAEQRYEDMLTGTLLARFAAQEQIVTAAALAVEALGGSGFAASPEVCQRVAATHALALHPPNRSTMARPITACLQGEPLTMVDVGPADATHRPALATHD